GARVVEKHFTLARADGGVDSAFSLEPAELADLVGACRDAAVAGGVANDGPLAAEAEMVKLRRSLYVVAEVPAGAVLTADHVRSIRPGGGLPPAAIDQVLGRRAARDLAYGEPLDWTMVVGGAPVG
ncbi:MAG: SAF domain-containing protein, partial [Pseudomonadota bacterium]|nr:SAF domain-containing protein [Pseudomonadota bacterium]